MRRFVLDSSTSLAWCFADEADEYAEATLRAMRRSEATVPTLWPYEMANGLWVGERRGRLTPAESARVLGVVAALPIQVEAASHERAPHEVLELARREGLACYDAAYLELAIREGLPLATLDGRLKEAAARVGVAEFDPS